MVSIHSKTPLCGKGSLQRTQVSVYPQCGYHTFPEGQLDAREQVVKTCEGPPDQLEGLCSFIQQILSIDHVPDIRC